MQQVKGKARLLSPAATAERLGLVGRVRDPHRVVLCMIRRGELVGVRIGRLVHVREDSVDRLIEGR